MSELQVIDETQPQDADARPTETQSQIMTLVRAEMDDMGRLPAERKLAEKLGVKRHQLRIALKFLREEGAVPRARPRNPAKSRRGGAQDMVSDTNPLEVIELRIMIEPTLARLAALRATPNMIAEMTRTADAIARGGAGRRGDLHSMIAAASGNVLASQVYDLLREVERDVRMNAGAVEALHPPDDSDQHMAIIAAIAARDPERAERTMRSHLAAIHRMMLSAGIS